MVNDENLSSQEHFAYHYHSHTQCKRPAFCHERKERANTIQNYKDTKRNLDPVTSNRKNHGDDKGVCRQVFRPLYLLRLTIQINFNLRNQL